MTKTELIERLTRRQPDLHCDDVEFAVKAILDQMSDTLAHGERIEIRGFGAFSLHRHRSRVARNPRTGEPVGRYQIGTSRALSLGRTFASA